MYLYLYVNRLPAQEDRSSFAYDPGNAIAAHP